jgi:hypothetical protein
MNGKETTLYAKANDVLGKHILYLEECVFVLMISDVWCLAFQTA